jgi:hypothetical protein
MADERAKRAAERVVNAIGDDRKFSGDAAVVEDIVSSEYADVLAENERLKDEKQALIDLANEPALVEMRRTIASLEQQVAALREDAERYRWLREDRGWETVIRMRSRLEDKLENLHGNSLDAAVDSARGSETE